MVDLADVERPRAVIVGCAGPVLVERERRLFHEENPLGFILFKRNCETPEQVAKLTADLRAAVGRPDAPVLIDQEGGRVQRLAPPHWPARPPQGLFARIAADDRGLGIEAAGINARLIAEELIALGIDVDCLPLLDVPVPDAHDVIGDRAYGEDPVLVADMGQAVVAGLTAGGVTPIVKHIPGHGRAAVDSHKELPRVDAGPEALRRHDFAPFRAVNRAPWAMTAHVVYEAFDPVLPASLSRKVIAEVIRGEIGFHGFLVSDDINMKALQGDLAAIAHGVVDAGCDSALHCSGDYGEMAHLLPHVPVLTDIAWQRFLSGRAARPAGRADDIAQLQAQLSRMIADWL